MMEFKNELKEALDFLRKSVENNTKKTLLADNARLNHDVVNALFEIDRIKFEVFLRVMINFSMLVPDEVFMEAWNKTGEQIIEFAEKYGEQYNFSKRNEKRSHKHKK